ncbi:MAG: hypothetical protein AAGI53_08870 [Planctomycetota bacterium]
MRCIIGRDQRELIERRMFPGCRVLEWGSGGSTLWLADRLPIGSELVSVDHHPAWHEKVVSAIGDRDNVSLMLAEASGPLGQNATIDEEDPTHLERYISAVDGQSFDVILVDGVARGHCMERAQGLLSDVGTVFLHDAQRDWYDWAKKLFVEHGTLGSCADYPGPLLWWGGKGLERSRASAAAVPLIVSFYTKGTPYEQEVDGLRQSCKRLGLEYHLGALESTGSWERNCAMKPAFIRDAANKFDRPVLWLDADAVVNRPPVLVAGAEMDFAVQKTLGWVFNSATVYLNRTPLARLLLDTWVGLCEAQPDVWDQIHLDTAWEMVTARHALRTQWLPQTYTKIFDMDAERRLDGAEPVIEQFQASRRFKGEVSTRVENKPQQHAPQDLIDARSACRVRRCWYDERYTLKAQDPAAAAWKAPEPAGV